VRRPGALREGTGTFVLRGGASAVKTQAVDVYFLRWAFQAVD
jgi:hypothetical protein